jgi:hypothetical protein
MKVNVHNSIPYTCLIFLTEPWVISIILRLEGRQGASLERLNFSNQASNAENYRPSVDPLVKQEFYAS